MALDEIRALARGLHGLLFESRHGHDIEGADSLRELSCSDLHGLHAQGWLLVVLDCHDELALVVVVMVVQLGSYSEDLAEVAHIERSLEAQLLLLADVRKARRDLARAHESQRLVKRLHHVDEAVLLVVHRVLSHLLLSEKLCLFFLLLLQLQHLLFADALQSLSLALKLGLLQLTLSLSLLLALQLFKLALLLLFALTLNT